MSKDITFWVMAMHPSVPAKQAYEDIATAARKILTSAKKSISTSELVEKIFPSKEATSPVRRAARDRIFKAMQALAVHELADCAERGPARKNTYGKMIKPWLWHAPSASNGEADRLVIDDLLLPKLRPYVSVEDKELSKPDFLGVVSDRIVDDLEAMEKNDRIQDQG